MSQDELQAVREYLQDNTSKGFIESSSAPFASPVLFVKKADGGLRFCVDYRKLNQLTKKDRYPLPLIEETMAQIGRAKIFTKLDIRHAFNRIRIAEGHEDLTTFRTRFGSYRYRVLPFGLTNGPATFQRYINDALLDILDEYVTAYMDDILIYDEDPLLHTAHVQEVLRRLDKAGLQVDIRKCEFNVTETKFLGLIVSTEGIKMDPDKIKTILEWERPQDVPGVQQFNGFCNFYRRFIKGFSKILKPLYQLTQKDYMWEWTDACERAFKELKDTVATDPILAHFD
jgi:hypothetical protein